MTQWAILTGEYPPQPGGVSDYTALIARGLVAAGDRVAVFVPGGSEVNAGDSGGEEVVRLSDRFGRAGRREVETALARATPDRVLVQYVPHAFGRKAMNVPFVRWVAGRLSRVAPVWAMFHEVAFPRRWWPPQHALLATVTRYMAAALARSASRVFVSIPAWATVLRRLCPSAVVPEWCPVPCTLPGSDAVHDSAAPLRERLAPSAPLVGHFGTYGPLVADLLTPLLSQLLADSSATVLLVGRGSVEYRERFASSGAARVVAVGELPPADVSAHLRACDLLVQPFPDGVSSRRTSAMAGLANGLPVVTNLGALSEPLWADGAVAAALIPDPVAMASRAVALLADPPARAAIAARGAQLYRNTFAVERTVAALRGTA